MHLSNGLSTLIRPRTSLTSGLRAFAAIAAVGAGSAGFAQQLQFSECAAAAGVQQSHVRPPPTFNFYGGGAAGDFNNDGWQDLFVLSGGADPDRLYINNGDGTFTDRAEEWGVARRHLGVGICVGDYTRNGWLDVFITSDGPPGNPRPGAHLLYRNNGDGTFTEVAAEAGVQWTSLTTYDGFGPAFGDYDLDGYLDLAIPGWYYQSGGNKLFRNNGDGTFTDVTDTAIDRGMLDVRGFSVRFTDMTGNRYPDLLWVADFRTSAFLVNNGDGTFSDHTAASGAGVEDNGMGQTVGDFNNDGLPDWYVTAIFSDFGPIGVEDGNALYINRGGGYFDEIARDADVVDGGWGWGTVAVDLDHDGWMDIVETNGWYPLEWRYEQSYVWRNRGDLTFEEIAAQSGLWHEGQGRGLLNLDYDNNGTQDIVLFAMGEPLSLFRNDLSGPDTNWLRVFLDTRRRPDIAPNGFGAKVVAVAGGLTQTRWIDGGSNYLSQSELSAHFGLAGANVVDELRVEWPNGRTTRLHGVAANQILTVSAELVGDLNQDGGVDLIDLSLLLTAFGACEGESDYVAAADLTGSGCVDIPDLFELLRDFGLRADR